MADTRDDLSPEMKMALRLSSTRLKMLRMERKLNMIDVMRATGISVPSLSNYERGIRSLDFYAMYQLSKFYDVSVDWLMGLTDVRK